MAKSEAEVTETEGSDEYAHLALMDGVALDDIPDRDPLLAPGTYDFQLVNFTTHFHPETQRGPMTRINLQLDPVEAVDVDDPQPDYTELRQFHNLFIFGRRDFRQIKDLAEAMRVDPALPAFEGNRWPALEAAKGEVVRADVVTAVDRRNGEPIRALKNFRPA